MKSVSRSFSFLSVLLVMLLGASDVMAERLEQESISESPWDVRPLIHRRLVAEGSG